MIHYLCIIQIRNKHLKITTMANANSNLKVFTFSGMGNFSISFNWDNGLSSSIIGTTTFSKAHEIERNQIEGGFMMVVDLPRDPEKGVFAAINMHGGTRNATGYVIAESKKEADELLKEFDERFEIVRYEQE